MPTYEYKCCECDHEWTADQPIKADPEKRCPKCGKETAKRLISRSGFILQGGCWSTDGYSK